MGFVPTVGEKMKVRRQNSIMFIIVIVLFLANPFEVKKKVPALTLSISDKLYLWLAKKTNTDQNVQDVIREILEKEMNKRE